MTKKLFLTASLIAAVLLLFGKPALAAPVAQDPPLDPDTLANLAYPSAVTNESIALVDGSYADEEAHVYMDLQADYTLWGDLDGDGDSDAAVFTTSSGGGSGTYWDMHAVLDEEGVATPVSSIFLGDRIEILEGKIDDDGAIVLELVVAGPNDALCCPTQHEQRVYRLVDDVLVLEEQTVLESAEDVAEPAMPDAQSTITTTAEVTASAEITGSDFLTETELTADKSLAVWSPDAEPRTALLMLGGGAEAWLDPMLVSVISGAPSSNERIDAKALGEGCTGDLSTIPDVVVNWTEDPGVNSLRFFTQSEGDPTLAVVTPTGEVLCSDDFDALTLDSFVEIEDPAEGRYAVYIGTFADRVAAPGFLVVTGSRLNPAIFRLASLLPTRANDTRSIPSRLPGNVLLARSGPDAVVLSTDNLPYTSTVTAGGEVAAFRLELGNPLCTGFVTVEPTLRFKWEGDAEELALFVEAEADTTLVVRDPNGAFQCNDDAAGSSNLNPMSVLKPIAGYYYVWVGSSSPDVSVDGILTIGGDASVVPAPLTINSEE